MKGNKPNLFIVGAMKSGTTSLHYILSEHPSIFMSDVKEPGYFVEELNWHKGENWYQNLFSGAKEEKYIGESSTHYTKLPKFKDVYEKIYSFNPNAKIIYIMRNPVERAISHYWHNIHLSALHIDPRFNPEKRPLYNAIREDNDYLCFSNYAMQLKPYISRFGSKNVFALTLEELINSPPNVLKRIFEWLDIPCLIKNMEIPRKNIRSKEIYKIDGLGILHKIRHSKIWDEFSPYFPKMIKRKLTKVTVKSADINTSDYSQARSYLISRQRKQVKELELLLNRKFIEWTEFYNEKKRS
jgi:hypothetical protein